MPDSSPDAVPGSELSPRDEFITLPPLRSPQSIDGEPYEAADAALGEFQELLRVLSAYAVRLESLVHSAMMSEALTLPEDVAGDVATYPDSTYELAATQRAGKAIGVAFLLTQKGRQELHKPVAKSRRLGR